MTDDKTLREEIATFYLESCIIHLANYFDGLENVPSELLDKSYEAELARADSILNLIHERIKGNY